MPNYTKPHDKDYEDTPEDYLYTSMVFARTLSRVLDDGVGILIDLKGDMLKLNPDAKRVVVFNDGDMIRIVNASERTDLEDGDWIKMISKDNISN